MILQVKLERVLGLTVSSNASLATAPSTGQHTYLLPRFSEFFALHFALGTW